METMSGIIKTIMFRHKFGFIRQEDGTDIFFHMCGVIKPEFEKLREGMPVEYIAVDSPKGKKAIGVVFI